MWQRTAITPAGASSAQHTWGVLLWQVKLWPCLNIWIHVVQKAGMFSIICPTQLSSSASVLLDFRKRCCYFWVRLYKQNILYKNKAPKVSCCSVLVRHWYLPQLCPASFLYQRDWRSLGWFEMFPLFRIWPQNLPSRRKAVVTLSCVTWGTELLLWWGSLQLPIFYLLLFLRFFSLFSSPRGELGFTASPKRDFVMSNAAWQKKLS